MKINVPHVAKLANLPLEPHEERKFEKQLSEIVTYVEKLKEVDTKSVEATSQVTGLENITREDEAKLSLTQDEALSNILLRQSSEEQAKSQHNGLFKVKAIFTG